jgi:hypothetical protein
LRIHAPLSRLRLLLLAFTLLALVPAAASAAPKKVKLQFSASSYTVVEGNTFNVVVLRAGNTRVPASVDYTTQNGSAVAGSDYTASSGTLNFAAGENRKTIAVATVDNNDASAASKTLTVKLSNGAPDSVPPGKTTATLRILDNDGPGTIDFSNTSYSVVEGAGIATITVTRASAANLVESVDYKTTELAAGTGHAIAGTDYTTTTGTLTFGTNEMSKSFQVPVNDDSVFEGDETLRVELLNPQNVTTPLQAPVIGTNNPATLTIVDDDIPTFSFSSPTYSTDEADTGTDTTFDVTVTRGGDTSIPASVGYSDAGTGTATASTDYTLAAGTVNFAAGDTSETFPVTIHGDNAAEGNETIGLQLTQGATQVGTALLSIVDNDDIDNPSVQFSNATYTVNEAASALTVTVSLSEPAAGGESVDYATSDTADPSHATAGSDYTATGGTLTFTAGQTSQTFNIPLLGDTDVEDDEDFRVTLSNEQNLVLGDPHQAAVTILDDDATGTLAFSSLSYNAGEASGHATVTVQRIGGSGGSASVDYASTDGTAHAPDDYTSTQGTLNFADGETQKTFEVPIAWDGKAEGDETVSLALTDFISDDDPDTTKAAVLHITDDGASAPVAFSAGSYDVSETAGSATITVNRSGGSLGGPVTVDYAGTDGTHGTLTFGAGDASKSFQVPVVDDNVHTGTRTVSLTLSNPGGGTSLGAPAAATLNIADNEPASSASTDKSAPKLKLTIKKNQKVSKLKRLVIKLHSNEAAKLAVKASLRKGKKLVRVAKGSKRVGRNKTVTIKLKLSKKSLAKVLAAMQAPKAKGKAKIKVSVTGTDAAGNKRTINKTVSVR